MKIARGLAIPVSCDLNYCSKLWTREQARQTMTEMLPFVDLIICNEEDAESVFGIRAGRSAVHSGKLEIKAYRTVCETLMKMFPTVKKVAITMRESISASDNNWSSVLWDGSNFLWSRKYAIRVVDRVGGGDAFAAGLIHGFLNEMTTERALEFAVAASCLKHTIPGDFNHCSLAEVEELLRGGGSGRVHR